MIVAQMARIHYSSADSLITNEDQTQRRNKTSNCIQFGENKLFMIMTAPKMQPNKCCTKSNEVNILFFFKCNNQTYDCSVHEIDVVNLVRSENIHDFCINPKSKSNCTNQIQNVVVFVFPYILVVKIM